MKISTISSTFNIKRGVYGSNRSDLGSILIRAGTTATSDPERQEYDTMKGANAFCPRTGASLSEKRYYAGGGTPRHAVIQDGFPGEPPMDGELTNGAVRSSTVALFNYFRRCHRRHYDENPSLYRKALLALRRIKRVATGAEEWDVHVWYTLCERLDAAGYETRWMHAHVELRCPECRSRLKYEELGGEVVARCGTNCTDDGTDRLLEIRTIIADLYSRTFDETIDSDSEPLRF